MHSGVKKVRVLVPTYAGSPRKADAVERSSADYVRGRPAKRTIEAWAEAPHFMPVGSKWQVVVPAAPLYGDRGAPAEHSPVRPLYFEIELVAIP